MRLNGVFSLAALLRAATAADTPYVQWLTDSFIKRGAPKDFSYTSAVLYKGVEAAIDLTGNKSYASWYQAQVDAVVQSDGSLKNWNQTYYSLDDQRFGNNVLWWYNRTRYAKYKTAAASMKRKFDKYPRTASGGFWHRDPQYPNQMWLDGIYMGHAFYSKYVNLFEPNNQTAWDDIALQFDLIHSRTFVNSSGLLVHGYDESKKAVWVDPVTGAAPNVWDRAMGWYFMVLLEVLEIYPKNLPAYKRLLGYYTSLAAALQKAQDSTCGYWLVMNEPYPEDKRNYLESSACAHFTSSFLRGMRLGLLPDTYMDTALKGWDIMKSRYIKQNTDGTLNWEGTVRVGSLDGNATFEYYISVPLASNDFKGAGPAILTAYEIEKLA